LKSAPNHICYEACEMYLFFAAASAWHETKSNFFGKVIAKGSF
jgi:hypothetical protein